ncbi:aromatic compound dioxygenase [Calocera viscosa TUFC12733]|uniref:Aromatic compound dioxygenase n=1 Tax=Calocera viscosa (strain TUFC12733) TaxID=1330018 RepID=A0A167MPT0_CALVF|nr:aromatic compound dioxygenase [Calocera viscosa TUFC12733]
MASIDVMRDPTKSGKAIRAQLRETIPRDIALETDFKEGTKYTITEHVTTLLDELCKNPRTLAVFTSLVKHLHAFARETELSHDEWRLAIEMLTRAGKESTDFKNEFILLSDTLGLSVLLDEVAHPHPDGATESCEEGPFFTVDAPELPSGTSLVKDGTLGEALYFESTVKNLQGEPIKGAKLEIWQADGDGLYDVQYPDRQEANNRARIVATDDGVAIFHGVMPTAYPIPSDGPVGDMLRATGRHPHRASHLHFHITAPGYDTLTTALYPDFSPFLGTDPVFATRKSLICPMGLSTDPAEWAKLGLQEGDVRTGRVHIWKYGFVLASNEEVAALKAKKK